ncbi:MAG: SusC/RagA family TonB-linked outer membrane protein [Bacteroidaceae bacterium]|nr:SusC/RagA family TonB-linked outer membrane protein [Bacteroidaceae bacterium]
MKERLLLFTVSLLLTAVTALAQNKITGTVIYTGDNEPVVGAHVMVQGTKEGTATDIDGKFTINVPAGKKLHISFVGLKPVVVTPKNGMLVRMEDDKILDGVVVTGMTKMDKRLFTGAATKVNAEDVILGGVSDVSRSLEGRVAGVSVQNVSGTFGTAPKIRVRGATSIYGSSKPLWVVDGVIQEDITEVSADDLSSGDAETLISSAIAGLNADDIESFQILKDGSATSIYGARAMSGVIVITTKKGKSGSSSINYTGEFTMRLKPSYNQFNIMNSQEQMAFYKELEAAGHISLAKTYRAATSGVYGKMYQLINTYDPITQSFKLANTPEAINEYLREAEMRNTDWFDELFSNSIQHNHSVSFSTGTDKAQYYASLSLMDDPGWSEQSKVRRYTANFNALYNINKKLSLNFIVNGSHREQRAPGTNSQHVDAVTGEVSRSFDINPYSYAINTSRAADPNVFYSRNFAPFNIHHELANNYMDFNILDLKLQAELKYKPISKVELSVLGAYRYSNTGQVNNITENSNMAASFRAMDDATMRDANPWLYEDPEKPNDYAVSTLPEGGFYRKYNYGIKNYSVRATAAYNDVFNEDHIVNVFAGTEVTDANRCKEYFNGVGFLYNMGYIDNYSYLFFKQAKEEGSAYYSVENAYERTAAFFATATYSYKARYTINGTTRYEGNNRLGHSRTARWLPTWNISGAWNAHEESWFEDIFKNHLTHGTIKLSYSLTGDRPPITNSLPVFMSDKPWRPDSKVIETDIEIKEIGNPNLTYEKKHEFNVGLDLGFLNNRINVQADFFTRSNYDLIGEINTNGTTGVVTPSMNVAEMKSNGQELSISTKNIITSDFKWNTDFIFTHVKTEVTKLKTNTRIIDLVSGTGFTMEGYPSRSLFSIDFRGLNESGMPTFINEKGELTISDINLQSRTKDYLIYEGPTDPTITGSLGNTFSYKGFRLNVFATYSFGNKVRLDPSFHSSYDDMDATPKEFKNRWTVSGDEAYTDIPAIADLRQIQNETMLNKAFNAYNFSSARTAKGDFIRMKEISLSYDFPQNMVSPLGLSKMSLKLQATNLFLIYADKKLNGQDPEFFNTGGVAIPMPRQFTMTLKLGI